eukprot:489589_1
MGCIQSEQNNSEIQIEGTTEYKEQVIVDGEMDYKNHYLYVCGYIPKDINDLYKWYAQLIQETQAEQIDEKSEDNYCPIIKELINLVNENGVIRMLINEMISQALKLKKNHPIKIQRTIPSLRQIYHLLNHIITTAPIYKSNKPDGENLDHATFPMSRLFGMFILTRAGIELFRNPTFNNLFTRILKQWCNYLDTKESTNVIYSKVVGDMNHGWISPLAQKLNKLDDFIIPNKNAEDWGFESYNAYFHRQIKPELRPISKGDNIIVSANDGAVYNIQRNVQRKDRFWIKNQPYSLINMLNNDEKYVKLFEGGDVFQSFLSGADYHRFHAPCKGKVLEINVVDGLTFDDPTSGNVLQGFESNVNTRGILYIEADNQNIGIVCVMPVGITEISSVKWIYNNTTPVQKNDVVEKGQEIGRFSYGGSSLCLLFQRDVIKKYLKKTKSKVQVNAEIAETY